MRQCPNCRSVADTKYCANCGAVMLAICPHCYELNNPDSRNCARCHNSMTATMQAKGGITTGDIGLFKGNIDNSTHTTTTNTTNIGNQYNAPVHQEYNYGPKAPTAAELFEQGKAALARKNYKRARDSFSTALNSGDISADLYYYYALSLLDGKRPKLLNLKSVQDIENQLQNATNLDRQCSHAWLLWAIVRYDYFTLNRLYHDGLTPQQLVNKCQQVAANHIDELILHIDAPENAIYQLCGRVR